MPDIEGVPYEASGGKVDQATAQALAARHREAASAGVGAASAAGASALADAKAYTDTKVTGLATTAAMQAGDQKALADAKAYTDEQVEGLDPLPAGGTTGQVLTKTSTGSAWQTVDPGDQLPTGGTAGQVLTKTSAGEVWADPAKGEKGDPGKDGADWSKDQQAKAQGYWIVMSPTEPESATYTTADGTTVPVIWQKPIEKMVPVIPEAPYFDKYALSVQVASLVGVDYYLTGFTKDGATVDVPDVKIPDGGTLKLADVSGKPGLPYTVNVEARAEPGYLLPNSFTWAYSVVDPNQVVLLTSDTFTGREEGSVVHGTPLDLGLGGSAMSWATGKGATPVISNEAAKWGPGSLSELNLKNVGVNQRVEFDLLYSTDYRDGSTIADGLSVILGAEGEMIFQARYTSSGVHMSVKSGYRTSDSMHIDTLPVSGASGRYVVELYDKSAIIAVPGVAPITHPLSGTRDHAKKDLRFRVEGIQAGYVSMDNLKVSKIGF